MQAPWPEQSLVHSEQSAARHPGLQSHEPSLCADPWPEHVVASEYWHELPTQSDAHAHVLSVCTAPCPEHVSFEYMHMSLRFSYLGQWERGG